MNFKAKTELCLFLLCMEDDPWCERILERESSNIAAELTSFTLDFHHRIFHDDTCIFYA